MTSQNLISKCTERINAIETKLAKHGKSISDIFFQVNGMNFKVNYTEEEITSYDTEDTRGAFYKYGSLYADMMRSASVPAQKFYEEAGETLLSKNDENLLQTLINS